MTFRPALPIHLLFACVLAACSAAPDGSDGRPGGDGFDPGNDSSGGGSGGAGGGSVVPTGGMGGGGGGDRDRADSVDGVNVCASASVDANRITPTVSLVIDGSSSMDAPFGNSTRWQALREALMGNNGLVQQLEGIVRFGSVVYGTGGQQCPDLSQVDPALNNYAAIEQQYPDEPPGTYTPTGEALMTVVDGLAGQTVQLDGPANEGPEIIILATDGEPNGCGAVMDWVSFGLSFIPGVGGGGGGGPQIDYGPTREAVTAADDKGIPTYVIAVGEDFNALEELQKVANMGQGLAEDADPGATLHTPQDPAALAQTLRDLVGKSVGCDVTLEGELDVDRACEGTVMMNSTELPCDDPNGWEPVDERTIRLNGSACEEWKNNAAALLDAEFPCGVVVIE